MAQLPEYVKPGDLLFERGTSLLGTAIRKITRSEFSHVAIVVNRDTVIEAYPGVGVRKIACPYAEGDYEIVTLPDLTHEQRRGIVAHAMRFIGTPYDYIRIVALFIEIVFHIHNRLFRRGHIICSSFATLAYMYGAGIRLRPDKPIPHVTPEDLYEDERLYVYSR